jgi:hypothetical protein
MKILANILLHWMLSKKLGSVQRAWRFRKLKPRNKRKLLFIKVPTLTKASAVDVSFPRHETAKECYDHFTLAIHPRQRRILRGTPTLMMFSITSENLHPTYRNCANSLPNSASQSLYKRPQWITEKINVYLPRNWKLKRPQPETLSSANPKRSEQFRTQTEPSTLQLRRNETFHFERTGPK